MDLQSYVATFSLPPRGCPMSFRVQTMFALHALVSVCMYDGSRLQHRLRAVPAVKPEAAPRKAIQHRHVLSCLLAVR